MQPSDKLTNHRNYVGKETERGEANREIDEGHFEPVQHERILPCRRGRG